MESITIKELTNKLNNYNDTDKVNIDFINEQLIITENGNIKDTITLSNSNTPLLFLKDTELYNHNNCSNRFKYISTEEHKRRYPSFIKDYLTGKSYTDLIQLEILLNSLYNKCRVNDLLRNEIISLNVEKYKRSEKI